ncbi:hypothetical protein PAAG_08315 [Paracoccidioides lutzii Pb01]|uniref:NADH:ubiquinone oxidoreductase 20.1kD subunit n=1 Tax=Paracoccidioides lutzii (strain ATCC MYA-826 / Pb01) TaxID=502779 RepID=C1HC24_PARBA|nr:hypothetical protein PAAG_08315 [Paracoccidioides lutzii Pb01]EEH38588.1 hypothetical protein PAAG_08315 [Paracoccidioides lutzii Pb01]
MLRQFAAAVKLPSRAVYQVPHACLSVSQVRYASQASVDDPEMNNNYYNPPGQKRQFRDPYGDWWDKQDRRNFGEPVHEDNDILTILSTETYTHFKPGKGLFLLGCAAGSVLLLSGIISLCYSDKPSAPRTFPDGLERELGGPSTVRARRPEEDKW